MIRQSSYDKHDMTNIMKKICYMNDVQVMAMKHVHAWMMFL